MSCTIPFQPEWSMREYWDGVDIHSPQVNYSDPQITLTKEEHATAAADLAFTLRDALLNGFNETVLKQEPLFDPTPGNMPDGTVFLLDRESLCLTMRRDGQAIRHEIENNPRPIEAPYTGQWIRNQLPLGREDVHFGEESAYEVNENLSYSRIISWGVVLTRERGKRVLAKWAHGAPKVKVGTHVEVPHGGDEFFRGGKELPLEVGQTSAYGEFSLPAYSGRMISRIKEIRMVTTDAGIRPRIQIAQREPASVHTLTGLLRPRPKPRFA